jgi:hypothetical protein
MYEFLKKEQYNPKTTANIAVIYVLCENLIKLSANIDWTTKSKTNENHF